jgi:transcriptional regulator with XRE-family HTH domain
MSNEQLPYLFGTTLRRLRAEFNWSQEHVAELADVSKNFISKLERGVQQPSLITLYRIAQAFSKKGSDLLLDLESIEVRRLEGKRQRASKKTSASS